MEQLLDDDNDQKSHHQCRRLRVKRNCEFNNNKNALLLHSLKLHKLSKQLFQLKVTKSNNRKTTAQFFSTACYRKLKISKRRPPFNLIRVAILFLLLILVYLFWHPTFFSNSNLEDYLKNQYRTSENSLDFENINLKQIENDLEHQHLFSNRIDDDRSILKLVFNTQQDQINEKTNKFDKEIKNRKIQNNDHRTSSVSVSSTRIPAHISEPIIYPFKNYSVLGKQSNYPALKSNRSSVSSIFPLQRKTTSILEKQLAWYELVGVTMFNLFGSSLAGQNSRNKKFKNQTNVSLKNSTSLVETVLLKPISSSTLQQPNNHLNRSHLNSHYQTAHHPNDHRTNNQTLGLIKNLKQRLPQSIVIGVRKAGTRAVLEYLTLNDHIKKADNELHFFDNDERYSFGLDYYRNQMPFTAAGQIAIEKSPAYFVTVPTVPERIKAMNASIKLILIVRDPVTRLISDYTQLAYNKLLKLDDLMRTSGSLNRQQLVQQKLRNHLFKFPVDKKKFHLPKQLGKATNEQSALDKASKLEKQKKIEKSIDENIGKSHLKFATDYYWNKIGSEPDYKAEKLDEVEQENDEQDDTLSSLPVLVKRQIRYSNGMNKRTDKSIDFRTNKKFKIIDSSARIKLKNSQKSKTKPKIDRQKDKIQDEIKTNQRISRQVIEQNIDQQDDEDEIYRTYKEYKELNPDDEDIEQAEDHFDDYLSSEKSKKINNKKNDQRIGQVKDEHWKIPKFENLVIRNGQVNTNYKPVKTSVYALYIGDWLRVFNRDQIHIVDGDRLIKEPHVELNKIETFLGLPQQIHQDQFVFNKKKKFFCARMYEHRTSPASFDNHHSSNSSTSWRLKSVRTAKNINKITGRHSSIRCLNSSKGRPHPQVDKQVISKLRQFYAPFNRHFERLVGMKFNWPEL